MDPNQYNKVGTVARAEPVNTMEVLFPNGFDRNLNTHDRPLITVCDTADDEGNFSDYDDSTFESNSPSDNVTVTIKFSPALDGVVTETAKSQSDSRRELFGTRKKNNVMSPTRGRRLSTESPTRGSFNDVDKSQEVLSPVDKKIPSDTPLVRNRERHSTSSNDADDRTSVQNSLYDDYEQFVEPPTADTEIVVRPKILKTRYIRGQDVNETLSRAPITEHNTDTLRQSERNSLVSPIHKTPIVIDSTADSNDEGEDFMEYLKQLRGEPDHDEYEESETLHDYIVEEPLDGATCDISMNINKTDELVPIFEVSATMFAEPETNKTKSSKIETFPSISSDNEDNSLLEFDFNSLVRPKKGENSTGIKHESNNSHEQSNIKQKCHTPTKNASKKTDKDARKRKKNIELKIVESSDDSESDDEEDEDSDSDAYFSDFKKDDDDSADGSNNSGNNVTDRNSKNGERKGETNERDNDRRNGGSTDRNNQHTDTSDMTDAGGACTFLGINNGMSIPVLNDTGFSETLSTASTASYSPEDTEVFEILDYSEIVSGLDCTFQIIEEISDISECAGSDYMTCVSETEMVNCFSDEQVEECELSLSDSEICYVGSTDQQNNWLVRDNRVNAVTDLGTTDKQNEQSLSDTLVDTIISGADTDSDCLNIESLISPLTVTTDNECPANIIPDPKDNVSCVSIFSDSSSTSEECDKDTGHGRVASLSSSEDASLTRDYLSDDEQIHTEDCPDEGVAEVVVERTSDLNNDFSKDLGSESPIQMSATGTFAEDTGDAEELDSNSLPDVDRTKYFCVSPSTTNSYRSEWSDIESTFTESEVPMKQPSVRTIYYMTPYIIETKYTQLAASKVNVFKRICLLRKFQLGEFDLDEVDSCTAYQNMDEEKESDVVPEVKIEDIFIKKADYGLDKPIRSTGRPGELMKLGAGYYIFGTGEKLDLPLGPKLKTKRDIITDANSSQRSIYFRGVPGIINNAYKMSSFRYPKQTITSDTSSRKILHACNRLATQLSPTSPRQEFKHVTMSKSMAIDEKDDSTSDSCSSDLTEMLAEARDFLNSSRFDEAETAFIKLYKEIQEKPEDSGRLLVETLTGLADICIRRSRMCRSNPLEWQWLCMHAIALLQYTVEFCDSELENQLDNEASDWYQEQRQASELKCRPLEDAFTRALYNCLKHDANFFDPFQSFSLPNTPTQQRKQNLFPLSSTMPQYLLVPGMSYRVTDQGLRKQSSDDSDVAVDWLAKFQFYCKDRLQTKDSKGCTEKVLKSNKSAETDETESILSGGSHDSLDWDHSDLHGIDEIGADETTVVTEQEQESPISDYSLEFELASSDNEGWDFFLHERRNCDFQSVVQVVSNKEKTDDSDVETSEMEKETTDIYQQEKSEKTRRKHHEPRDIVSPLHAHSISLTLARSFCRLADKLVQEEEYKKAEIVYEKILDIIDAIQDGTAGMLRFSARIMKNLGTVKSKQGKSSSGLVLLNKALNTYRDLQDEEANFEIAVALIELGNGYIVGKNHEDSVFDDVIIAICDFFEKDASDSHSTSTSSSVQSHISQMTSSLSSNNEDRNVEEAVTCYSEAISLLDCYEADEKQIDMFAKAVMRLGDCHFMQKDYDKALECYEKALGMFRTYNVFGKDSLMENAHVLCMLGVSSFMLHVYPRAASVFETALHMVRCAYGFKRTFLNGMLQSLCGITYYKMKNYHKCVSMCYQGYETYCELFNDSMPRLDKQKFWLVCQTLYVMGNSYNVLSLQHKAMKYLSIARSLMKSSKSRERRQFMRVLQILGDCYFAQYDYKAALQFYNEALEYGECESSISFDEVFDPNCASDEMTIHNHLVSKSAEAHLSMQQYQNAVHYLEQAHDMQEVMGEDIKGDLIHTLHQLGHMHSSAGDVDKAIESYKECLEVFREIHKGELGPEMCTTLGNLAAISYVKACLSDSFADETEMYDASDAYFQEALKLENNVEVSIKYGNFLYSQCHFETATVHLWNALTNDNINSHIVYRGLEKVTLPELLQDEVDTQEEICLPASCLARYLLVLCHKAMHEMEEAEINLVCLMEDVLDYDIPLMHSLLGYAMMELCLFEEAAECFLTALASEEDYQLACENYCICQLILLQKTLIRGVENILEHVSKTYPTFCIDYEACP